MRRCRDCQKPLEAIYALDKDGEYLSKEGFGFTVAPPEHGFFGGVKNVAGTIHAWMCPTCHRVEWYAEMGERS